MVENEGGNVDAVSMQPSEHVGVSEGVEDKADIMFERMATGSGIDSG